MYKKKSFPEKGEFVICTVKKVLPHSAFVILDEYENKEGMIHASEISRKWVRNIKKYMKKGNKLVCKVMDVDPNKNHINLSVKRVGSSQKRNKQQEWSDEKKANNILEVFAKLNKLSIEKVYEKIGNKILDKYGLLYPVFIEVSKTGGKPLEEAGINKKLVEKLTKLIQNRIKPPKAEIEGLITMSSNEPNGLKVVKSAIEKAEKLAKKEKSKLKIQYLGAPKYKFKIISDNYKTAEKILEKIEDQLDNFMRKHDGFFKISRD